MGQSIRLSKGEQIEKRVSFKRMRLAPKIKTELILTNKRLITRRDKVFIIFRVGEEYKSYSLNTIKGMRIKIEIKPKDIVITLIYFVISLLTLYFFHPIGMLFTLLTAINIWDIDKITISIRKNSGKIKNTARVLLKEELKAKVFAESVIDEIIALKNN